MGTRLFIGNLPFTTTEDDLHAILSEGGRTVKEIHIPSDRETGRPRGFAFADMGSEADAQSAIKALDGPDLDGRRIKVNEAQPRPTGGGGRGGGGGGGGGGGDRGHGKRREW